MTRRFRFLADAREIASIREFTETARRAEAIGIDTLVVPDHLIGQLAPIPTMAAIAAVSDTPRVAAFVLNNDPRHPAVLAHDLASLDVQRGPARRRHRCRLEPEYEAIGVDFDPTPCDRRAWPSRSRCSRGTPGRSASPASTTRSSTTTRSRNRCSGRILRSSSAAAGGERLARGAGRHRSSGSRRASCPTAPPRSITFEGTREKIGVREAAGDGFDELELNVYPSMTGVSITDEPLREARGCRPAAGAQRDRGLGRGALDSPQIFVNTVDGFVEKLQRHRDQLGISSVMVGVLGELDPVVERLAGT